MACTHDARDRKVILTETERKIVCEICGDPVKSWPLTDGAPRRRGPAIVISDEDLTASAAAPVPRALPSAAELQRLATRNRPRVEDQKALTLTAAISTQLLAAAEAGETTILFPVGEDTSTKDLKKIRKKLSEAGYSTILKQDGNLRIAPRKEKAK